MLIYQMTRPVRTFHGYSRLHNYPRHFFFLARVLDTGLTGHITKPGRFASCRETGAWFNKLKVVITVDPADKCESMNTGKGGI